MLRQDMRLQLKDLLILTRSSLLFLMRHYINPNLELHLKREGVMIFRIYLMIY